MAATTGGTTRLGLGAPLGVLLAGVAAGLVFVIPMPFLKPETPVITPPTPPAAPPAEEKPFIPETPPWAELAGPLTALREPPPAIDPATGSATPDATVAEAPPPAVELNWRYVGKITEPTRVIAVLMVDTNQKIVAQGDWIDDPNNPGTKVEVVGVDGDKVAVDYKGRLIEFALVKQSDEPPAAMGSVPPALPVRAAPPTRNPQPGGARQPSKFPGVNRPNGGPRA